MTNILELPSVAITGEIMGVGTTTQAKSLAEALELSMIPSGGAFRRHLSHTWKVFNEKVGKTKEEGIVWQEFQKEVMDESIEIIPIEHSEQSEDDLKEFDRVEDKYVDADNRRFWETLIDKKSIFPLLNSDDPKVGEGKLLIIAEKLGLNAEGFNDSVVRFCLTVRGENGKIDLIEVGERILKREIANQKIKPPKGDREKEALAIRTVSNSLVRNEGHWKRWNEVYAVKWEDIGKESEDEGVYTINTRKLNVKEVQLAMRLAYLYSVPQCAPIILDTISELINEIEAEREIEEVFADIRIHAPAIAPAIPAYLEFVAS